MRCARCGTENPEGSRFCMECGAPLTAAEPDPPAEGTGAIERPAAPPPPARTFAMPPPVEPSVQPGEYQASDLPPTHPEWRMSPVGPLPEQPRRRIWLWVAGIIGGCLLICVLLMIWASTAGRPVLDDLGTRAAIEATNAAAP